MGQPFHPTILAEKSRSIRRAPALPDGFFEQRFFRLSEGIDLNHTTTGVTNEC
ncbi:hypothetical protein [Paraburkholderia terrae]|uniref:hypothetical protein n=1 Tax=Paraburkholderia terrae TaxID=311230 RepID=UPI0020BFD0A6|nr:hypothetical protein [Paraburkholderia terrae]